MKSYEAQNLNSQDEQCDTLDPKSFDYQFLAKLDERGQGIPNDGDKRGGRKGYQSELNYNLIER